MVKFATIFFIFLNIFRWTVAQEKISFYADTWFNYRLITNESIFDPGLNGAALLAGINIPVKNTWKTGFATEFGAAGVGNYFSISAGLLKEVTIKESGMVFSPGINILQGAALFRSNPLYMAGIEQVNFLGFQFRNGSRAGLILGCRYYGFPGYSSYSSIYRFIDFKAGIRYMF